MVWLHPKTSSNTCIHTYDPNDHAYNQTHRTETQQKPGPQEQKIIESLQRDTKASMAKKERTDIKRLMADRYLNEGKHSWNRMDYFQDCHNCVWKADGTVKKSTKL